MKNLEQELAESKVELKKLSYIKPVVVDDRSSSIPLKPKVEKVYIPPFNKNHKQKVYVARLDKSKSSEVDIEVSKPSIRVHKKSVFVLIYIQLHVIYSVKVQLYILLKKNYIKLKI